MRMPSRSKAIPWWLFGAAVLVVYGFMAAKPMQKRSDTRTEIAALFAGDDGSVVRMPRQRRTWNVLESGTFAVRVKKADVNVGRNRFQETERGLESIEGGDMASEFHVSEIHSLFGRLAWVRGELTARSGGTDAVRPFVAVLVKVGGEWRTVIDQVGSRDDVAQWSGNGAACSCSCRRCSSKTHG